MLRQIDINDWYKFGDGGTADSFYHKDDESVMMKLYYEGPIAREEAISEYEVASIAANLGLPVVKELELVECEGRTGIIFERIRNKESIGRAIGNGSLSIAECASIMSDLAKKLHSTPADVERMTPILDSYRSCVRLTDRLSDSEKARFMEFFDSVEGASTCLHGDFHLGNIIVANGKSYAIDLSRFAYGDPMFDIAGMHYIRVVSIRSSDVLQNDYHIMPDQAEQLWVELCKCYAGIETPDELACFEKKLAPYCACDALLKGFAISFGYETYEILREYMDLAGFSD